MIDSLTPFRRKSHTTLNQHFPFEETLAKRQGKDMLKSSALEDH